MVVVYTTIFGESDSLKKAPDGASRCVCFVDDPAKYPDARGWDLVQVDTKEPRRDAWYTRCVPHLLFPDARKTVWVDASFTITDLPRLLLDSGDHAIAALTHHSRKTCFEEGNEIVRVGQASAADIDAQLNRYRQEGFWQTRLSISCIIVRNNTPSVTAFNVKWRDEIRRHRGDNTQLSLDYAAWKAGLIVHPLQGVRKNNPYAIHDHSDHKRRRKPYDTEVPA